MRRELEGLLLALAFALGLMGGLPASAQDLSSPKATVRTFIAAVNKRDKTAIQHCILGETRTDMLGLLFGSGQAPLPDYGIVTLLEEREGDHARVATEYTLKPPADPKGANRPLLPLVDLLTLEKQGERWLLVTDPATTKAAKEGGNPGLLLMLGQTRPLSFAVALAAAPEMVKAVEQARDAARSASCLSNLRQIGLALMLYMQDHDEYFPPKADAYVDKITTYTKTKQVFTCPLDPAGTTSYSFNSGIAGVALAVITNPAKTVLVYEGKDGKLDYRHDGQAHVAFADGHVRAIKPEEANGLIWTVKAPAQRAQPAPNKSLR